MVNYIVDIQPSTGYEFKNEHFTVTVEAGAGDFAQASRRAVRRAVARAHEWNAQNSEVIPRPAYESAYRVVGVRVADFPGDPKVSAAHSPQSVSLLVSVDPATALAILSNSKSR